MSQQTANEATEATAASCADAVERTRAAAVETMATRLLLLAEGAVIEAVLDAIKGRMTTEVEPAYERLGDLLRRYEAVEERMDRGGDESDIALLEALAREAGNYAAVVGGLAGEAITACAGYVGTMREALRVTEEEVEARAEVLVAERTTQMAERAAQLPVQ